MNRFIVRTGALLALSGIAVFYSIHGRASSPEVSKESTAKASVKKVSITYSKQIARIVQNRCQTCHHAGTAAPFSLTSYEDAVNWSETIREVLVDKRMPPWHADPRFGHFSNDRRLPQ